MCIIAESMQHILHSSPYNAYMYQFRVYLTDKIKYEKRNTQVWWPVPHATESVSISEARSLKYTHTTGEVEGSERERTCLHFALLVFVGAGQLLSRVGRGLGIVWEEELGEAILVPRVCRGSVRVWRVGAGGGGGNTLPLVGMCRILKKKRSGVSKFWRTPTCTRTKCTFFAHIIGCHDWRGVCAVTKFKYWP